MIKIGIDGLPLKGKKTGVGNYVLSIVRFLHSRKSEFEITIYSNDLVELPDDLKDIRVVQDHSVFRKLKAILWLKYVSWFFIRKDNLDYYLSGYNFLPRLPKKVKSVLVIHDLNYKVVPETMSFTHYLTHFAFLKSDARKADYLIANSTGTSKKIEHYFGVRTHVILHPEIGSLFQNLDQILVRKVLAAHDLTFPYFLAVGTIEPRKNLITVVKSFLALKEDVRFSSHRLVLAGSMGWKNSELVALVESHKDCIITLGYVKDEFLPYLYSGAELFLFPSIYEGFGIPVREALQCGTRVITSNIDELNEAGMHFADYVSPLDQDHLIKKILEVYQKPKLRNVSFNNNKQYQALLQLLTQPGCR